MSLPSDPGTSAVSASTAPVAWADPAREHAFAAWLAGQAAVHAVLPSTVRAASADASFRRYLRVDTSEGGSLIVMDAPPQHEDCRPFVKIARLLRDGGVAAPEILA